MNSDWEIMLGTCMSAYVEIDYGDLVPPFSDPITVFSLTEGSFVLGKDYAVFDALAGGRRVAMRPHDRERYRDPLISPRGMPSPCSLSVGWDYYRVVANPTELPDKRFWPEWLCVSPAVAADWLENQGCFTATIHQWFNCEPKGLDWQVVSVPGLYNASWLRLDEYNAAVARCDAEVGPLPVEYGIIGDAMARLVAKYGHERTRLVIWFS